MARACYEASVSVTVETKFLLPGLRRTSAGWSHVLGRVCQSIERIVAICLDRDKSAVAPNGRDWDRLRLDVAVVLCRVQGSALHNIVYVIEFELVGGSDRISECDLGWLQPGIEHCAFPTPVAEPIRISRLRIRRSIQYESIKTLTLDLHADPTLSMFP